MYENPWKYSGKIFESEDIKDHYGFVYCITNLLNGKKYIGRKYFWNLRKTKKSKRRVRTEANWKEYYGSSKELLADIKKYGEDNFSREILSLHNTKGQVNFHEIREQFINDVLTKTLDNGDYMYYNENILGRYFRKVSNEDQEI